LSEDSERRYGAGDPVEDLCRVCKMVRRHTVIAADDRGRVLRVLCGSCGSQHNYRGARAATSQPATRRSAAAMSDVVTARERRYPPMTVRTDSPEAGEIDLELLLRRIIREETGLTPAALADKWHGGELILKPGKPNLQDKSWPIETFFHKVILLRNRLRVLEQQINSAEIPAELKIKLQSHITGCYGSLTSFNVLFAEEQDRFRGSGGDE